MTILLASHILKLYEHEHDWIAQVVGLSSVVPGDPVSTLAHPNSTRTDTNL